MSQEFDPIHFFYVESVERRLDFSHYIANYNVTSGPANIQLFIIVSDIFFIGRVRRAANIKAIN